MRILVLTDHRTHHPDESIYPLLRELAKYPAPGSVVAATRSRGENEDFFSAMGAAGLTARPVDDSFLYSDDGRWFLEGGRPIDARDFDVIFLRVDRPISEAYLKSLPPRLPGQRIINDPRGIWQTGAKDFLLGFPQFCAPTRVCRSVAEVEEARREYPLVLKPVWGYGGKHLFRVDGDRAWNGRQETTFESVRPLLEQRFQTDGPMVAVKFLPMVRLGDKRVLVVRGEVVGSVLRIPAAGSWLANLSQGATPHYTDLEAEEREMAAVLSPVLEERGVVIYGFDTLTGNNGRRVLSEVNTLNVGGFAEAEQVSNRPIISRTVELLWEAMVTRSSLVSR